jgi:hypothetical protein
MPAVEQHMVDGVQIALDWIEEYLDLYGRDNVELLTERRVYIGKMIGVDRRGLQRHGRHPVAPQEHEPAYRR